MKVCLGGLLGDLGDLGDLGEDFFTENMPPRLTRLTLLMVLTMISYMHIANIKSNFPSLQSSSRNVHLFCKRLDDFFMCMVIAFDVFV